jgi:hypothetical protein
MKLTNMRSALSGELALVVATARKNLAGGITRKGNDGKPRRGKIDTTGNLSRSIKVLPVRARGNKVSGGITMAPYGDFVDQGVSGTQLKTPKPSPFSFKTEGPGMAMTESILEWMKKKNIRVRDERGRYAKGGFESYQFKGLAYVIARSIKRKGTPQTYFITAPFRTMTENLPRVMAEAIAKDFEEYITTQFDQK